MLTLTLKTVVAWQISIFLFLTAQNVWSPFFVQNVDPNFGLGSNQLAPAVTAAWDMVGR